MATTLSPAAYPAFGDSIAVIIFASIPSHLDGHDPAPAPTTTTTTTAAADSFASPTGPAAS